jgi:hypothetical protein
MNSAASEAGRALSAKRWGSQRLVKLSGELRRRPDELPDIERQRLLAALQDHQEGEKAAT